MKTCLSILFITAFLLNNPGRSLGQQGYKNISIDFFGDPVNLAVDTLFVSAPSPVLSTTSINSFYETLSHSEYQPMIEQVLTYKKKYQLDDWLYYQLVRRIAQEISPKKEDYTRYTLYKWFLMLKSGFDVRLKISGEKILFYTRTDDDIYNIPYYIQESKQYVCLNYHDYGNQIDFAKEKFNLVEVNDTGNRVAFSYRINHLPEFHPSDYREKDLHFVLNDNEYDFRIKLNPQVNTLLNNYPVVDYASYFNIPLSRETYNSLIPALKKTLKGLNIKNGIDYLMRFTRYAFLFAKDNDVFGGEKRLSPEQTLLFDQSDCEDRAALFFYLVKEIYNLPMIVLSFPEHITIAVKLDKPVGTPIIYKGEIYSVCEPTPQKTDLNLGQLLPSLKKTAYEVAYAYQPEIKK